MRYIALFPFLMGMALSGCAQNSTTQDKNTSMNNIPTVPKKKQITYAVHINAKTPYEIFIDDIPIRDFGRYYESGMNATLELNPYLLRNGIHTLKVRYLPLQSAKDSLLHPGDVYFSKDAKWNIFFVRYIKNQDKPLGYEGEIDYGNSELTVNPPPKPVPVWEQTFKLPVKDLPYKLTGWSQSQDLSKMDKDTLKEEVVAYFRMLRNLLNEGKVDKFLKLNRTRDREYATSTYDEDLKWYISQKRKNELLEKCKGNMWPVNPEDYALKLYANGRIVTLERVNNLKNQGLIAETKEYYHYYGFKLHKPKGSDGFEIIRL